jgi:hypothetical protein
MFRPWSVKCPIHNDLRRRVLTTMRPGQELFASEIASRIDWDGSIHKLAYCINHMVTADELVKWKIPTPDGYERTVYALPKQRAER